MRQFFLFSVMVFVCSSFAYAQEQIPPECRILTNHVARDDVAFQSGVDIKGKPVVPADLNAAPIAPPQKLIIPLSINMAERLENSNIAGLDLTGTLGFLEIESNGRVVYNGADITSQAHVLCGKQVGDDVKSQGQSIEENDEPASTEKQ